MAEAVEAGADLVTFSGDKLLGGPRAGFIVGRADRCGSCNPMKRAMRLDKIRIAALAAVLRLYRDPDTVMARVPTLRMLSRPKTDIAAQAERLRAPVGVLLAPLGVEVSLCDCDSQVGSGALPTDTLPSSGLRLSPLAARRPGPSASPNGFAACPCR